jgi:hypothetical protein
MEQTETDRPLGPGGASDERGTGAGARPLRRRCRGLPGEAGGARLLSLVLGDAEPEHDWVDVTDLYYDERTGHLGG